MIDLCTPTDLPYPQYTDDGSQQVQFTDQKLFTEEELQQIVSKEAAGEKLVWINYFKEITDDSTLASSGEPMTKQYKGQWRASDMTIWEGFGTIKFSDGNVYEGQTKNGLYNGRGRMTHVNGDIYQGFWKDGKANGYGVFIDVSGNMYKGEWVNDQQHGMGTESWNFDRIKYVGEFREGKKTGQGKFEFDGGYYEGEFEDGKFHGQGRYYFADTGRQYEGEFRDNNMEGRGVMTWPDGSKYEGEFKNGKMDGEGTKVFTNGNKYIG